MTMRTGKSGRYHYYACANWQARGSAACSGCSHLMGKIDAAVTDALAAKAFQPDRLAAILHGIEAERRTTAANNSELVRLESELADARVRIERLLIMVERGLSNPSDPDFALRLNAAQRNRDIAASGCDRIRRRMGSDAAISPERIVAFANFMRDRIRNGDIPYRKSYLRAVIERISVDDGNLVIFGQKDALRQQISRTNDGGESVPTGVQEWRTRQDSNL